MIIKGAFLPKWFIMIPKIIVPNNAPRWNNDATHDASSIEMVPVGSGDSSLVYSSMDGEVHPSKIPKDKVNKFTGKMHLIFCIELIISFAVDLPTMAVRYWYFTLCICSDLAFTCIILQWIQVFSSKWFRAHSKQSFCNGYYFERNLILFLNASESSISFAKFSTMNGSFDSVDKSNVQLDENAKYRTLLEYMKTKLLFRKLCVWIEYWLKRGKFHISHW